MGEVVPTSVWTTGPVDDTQPWPPTIVARAVTEFSQPGDTVVLLPFTNPVSDPAEPATSDPDTQTTARNEREALSLAAATVTAQARHATTAAPPTAPTGSRASETASTPFWAAMIDPNSTPAPAAPDLHQEVPPAGDHTAERSARRGEPEAGSADLVITWAPPDHVDPQRTDAFVAEAARLLRTGGTLAVITHSDWNSGRLIDPTGVVVAAAQNADLLYLQHIAALHSPIRGAELQAPPTTAAGRSERDRAVHRATVRGLPMPHHRAHSDVLAFAQPAYHSTAFPNPETAPPQPNIEPAARTPNSTYTRDAIAAGASGGDVDVRSAGSVWSVWPTAQKPPATQRKTRYTAESVAHPAKMLPAIAAHAIAHYTEPGDLVADPMCGIGTTLVEAVRAGRRAFGVEYEPQWAHAARANLDLAHGHTQPASVLQGDARLLARMLPADIAGQAALIVTSPPYGPSAHGHVVTGPGKGVRKSNHRYGNTLDRGNLANIGHDRLLSGFTRVLAGCARLLRPGGHVVITVRPWREHSELIDLPSQVIACGVRAGLIPTERCVALLSRVAEDRLVARGSFFQRDFIRKQRANGLPLHLIAHEDVVILRAPLTRSSSSELKGSQEERVRAARTGLHTDTRVAGKFEVPA